MIRLKYAEGRQAEHRLRGRLKKRDSRVSTEEVFTRLLYYGTIQMGLSQREFWDMPIGLFLDLWECHRQYNGTAKVRREFGIDEIIPYGI